MTTDAKLVTIADLEQMPGGCGRSELLDGVLVEMPPAGAEHNWVMNRFDVRLSAFVEANDLGVVFPGDTGIILRHNPDCVRAPDLCFFSRERLPAGRLPKGYFDIVPDLVVEIVSPGDRAGEIQEKTAEWLEAGVRLVWTAYPNTRTVVASDSLATARTYRADELLPGDPVLPGFSVPVSAFFA